MTYTFFFFFFFLVNIICLTPKSECMFCAWVSLNINFVPTLKNPTPLLLDCNPSFTGWMEIVSIALLLIWAECSSVDSVPAFEAVGRRIDHSQWNSCSLGYFPFQPVVHNWFIKGRGMYCSVYGKVHIKDPFLLIEKSSLCGGSGFPSKKCVNVTIWMTSNNRW